MFLVGQVGYAEQLTLEQLTKALQSYTVGKSQSTIFVVHNFRHLQAVHELQSAWQEVKNLYKGLGFSVQHEEITLGVDGKMETFKIEYMAKAVNPSIKTPQVAIMHFVLGADDSPAGHNNPGVIERIRRAMTQTPTFQRPKDFLSDIQAAMSEKVKAYLSKDSETEIVRADNFLKLVRKSHNDAAGSADDADKQELAEKSEKVLPLKDMDLGNYISIAKRDMPSIKYRILQQSEEVIRVEIDLPGLTLEDMRETKAKGEPIVDLQPENAGVKIILRPWLIPRPVTPGDHIIEELPQQDSHNPSPQLISIKSRLLNWKKPDRTLENGILIFKWGIEIIKSDDDSWLM